MSPDALQQLRMLTATMVCPWVRSGRTPTMKFHVTAEHLAEQMAFAGNCTWTHNYSDESGNFETRAWQLLPPLGPQPHVSLQVALALLEQEDRRCVIGHGLQRHPTRQHMICSK